MPVVAVFGSSTMRESDPFWAPVEQLGAGLAKAGLSVMSGGYNGAMAAVSRGAREAGGHVVGVTVEMFEKRGPANEWVHERVHTSDIYERLRHLVTHADAFVAVNGSVGTLTELFLTWMLLSVSARPRAPFVLMGPHWRAWLEAHRSPELVPERLFELVEVADTPEDAVRAVVAGLGLPAAGNGRRGEAR